jgi:RecA-family ATPase
MTALPSFDRPAIEAHVSLIHDLAEGLDGTLILAAFEEGGQPNVQRFRIGDVAGMVETIMGFENHPSANLYAPWSVFRRDLAPGRKGAESDVVAVLAAVPDLDNDKYTLGKLPVEAPYIVETSPGNFQPIYIFDKPLSPADAKPALAALSDFVGGDSGTKDCSHVWRIPGTLNIPTKSKLARGRPAVPAPVTVRKPYDGTFVRPEELLALAPTPRRPNGHDPAPRDSLPFREDAKLRSALAVIQADDRDTWLKVGAALHLHGARAAWDDWSKTSSKFDAADQERVWASFHADRKDGVVTIATIYGLAIERGWEHFASAAAPDGSVLGAPGKEADKPNGETPLTALNVFSIASFAGKAVPVRAWLVPDVIPANQVTILSGNGGDGKSLLALQLGVAVVTATGWIGYLPEPGGVLYVSAEDDPAEIHRRIAAIIEGRDDLPLAAMLAFNVIDLSAMDALLAAPQGRNGVLATTALFKQIEAKVTELRPSLLVIDALADVYGGDENVRGQVRQFIALLRQLALKNKVAVLLVAHPSLSGMATGSGTSGSTGWSNSVRSRLYLEPAVDDDGEADPCLRKLTVMKANYAAKGTTVALRWERGRFVLVGGPGSFERMAAEAKDDGLFLKLLKAITGQGRNVSPYGGQTSAPKVFAEMPDGAGVKSARFKAAMERFLRDKKIECIEEGPPSRRHTRIVEI